MKQSVYSLCAIAVLMLVFGAYWPAQAQTPSATPDPFVVQLTSSPSSAFGSFVGDMSGNGRFVVFESNGDLATERDESASRNNADGNREIFLIDYAQRRIFQITDTRNVPKPAASPSPTPTPSPTPSPLPTPADLTQVQVEISNNRPMISFAPALNANGRRVFTIVFSSNAPNPASFDGTDPGGALAADGNQEIWVYELPEVEDVNLSLGDDLPLQDLAGGTFTRITDTPASRPPSPGSPGILPVVADDNRFAVISEDGRIIAFESSRDLVPAVGNEDGNPEIFFYNRNSSSFIQVTDTESRINGVQVKSIFNESVTISADASVFAFISNANLVGENDDENAEIYIGNFNGATVSNLRQVTNTTGSIFTVNLLSPGRRLSRDGVFLAFESLSDNPLSVGTNQRYHAIFLYNANTDSATQVGPRTVEESIIGDVIRFPTFTDYIGLQPRTLIFSSALNFRPDGTFPAEADDDEGMNPDRVVQIFATEVPASSSNTFTRLTRNPFGLSFGGYRAIASETRRRITFSLAGVELGGGNLDLSTEVFYLLTPQVLAESAAELSLFTGASRMEVPMPDPSASPTPTPSPSPGTAIGLAAGELSILRSTVGLAPANATAGGASETTRSPALPVELNGVSLAIDGAAAGLYFVGDSPAQINFVMPIGLDTGTQELVVNNNGTVHRGGVAVVPAQPDIFTTTNDAGGRAIAFNITNPLARTGEPFTVTSLDENGEEVATVLELNLTGIRGIQPGEVTFAIGQSVVTGAAILSVRSLPEMPGFDIIVFRLPAELAGAGDVPIIVTVTRAGVAVSSRHEDTAPRITIN